MLTSKTVQTLLSGFLDKFSDFRIFCSPNLDFDRLSIDKSECLSADSQISACKMKANGRAFARDPKPTPKTMSAVKATDQSASTEYHKRNTKLRTLLGGIFRNNNNKHQTPSIRPAWPASPAIPSVIAIAAHTAVGWGTCH